MKRSITLVAILSFLTLQTIAQTFDFRKGSFTTNEYLIELPYQNVIDKIIIEIALGGKNRRFLLDTGIIMADGERLLQLSALGMIIFLSIFNEFDESGGGDLIMLTSMAT